MKLLHGKVQAFLHNNVIVKNATSTLLSLLRSKLHCNLQIDFTKHFYLFSVKKIAIDVISIRHTIPLQRFDEIFLHQTPKLPIFVGSRECGKKKITEKSL